MQKLKWTTERRKVNNLLPFEINPRKITDIKKQELIKSIEKFNLAEIPAINKDNTIISGHQRIKALQLIGRGEEIIDVRIPNRQLSKEELKEYNLLSNTHAGEWDYDILELEFSDISTGQFGFEIEGWGDWRNKQDALLASEAQEDDFDVPVGGSETNIVEGDIFEIGNHRLLCGDATRPETWKRLMGDDLADLVITDPPYNVSYIGKTKESLTIKNDSMSDENFYQFLFDFYTALGVFTKPGGGGMFGMLIQKG